MFKNKVSFTYVLMMITVLFYITNGHEFRTPDTCDSRGPAPAVLMLG